MGLFGKIKNILFEEDEEIEETMPDFSKDVKKEREVVSEKKIEVPKIKEKEIELPQTRFNNVKREIDIPLDESDLFADIEPVSVSSKREVSFEMPKVKIEEKKPSPFQSFNEEEFNRLNARINKNEEKVKRDEYKKEESKKEEKTIVRENNSPITAQVARRANNNFSSTTPSINRDLDDRRRRMMATPEVSTTKKAFSPSPVISPVYGILNKNYQKEDIIDRVPSSGDTRIKKEVVKSIPEDEIIVKTEVEENIPLDIDSIRKKAFGEIEKKVDNISNNDVESSLIEEEIVEKSNEVKPSVECEITEKVSVDKNSIEEEIVEKEIVAEVNSSKELGDYIFDDVTEVKPKAKRGKTLEEIEKTSTLQILDDIEKELNAIKPITEESNTTEEIDVNDDDQSLESDLFNLIDSMYEEGENDLDD